MLQDLAEGREPLKGTKHSWHAMGRAVPCRFAVLAVLAVCHWRLLFQDARLQGRSELRSQRRVVQKREIPEKPKP